MEHVTLYRISRCGQFNIVPPYVTRKVIAPGNSCKWRVFGHREGVSAIVLEQALSHQFKTKRDALRAIEQIPTMKG